MSEESILGEAGDVQIQETDVGPDEFIQVWLDGEFKSDGRLSDYEQSLEMYSDDMCEAIEQARQQLTGGAFLRGIDENGGKFGFEIPMSEVSPETIRIEASDDFYEFHVAWDTSVDVSSLVSTGARDARVDDERLDGYVGVDAIEVVPE